MVNVKTSLSEYFLNALQIELKYKSTISFTIYSMVYYFTVRQYICFYSVDQFKAELHYSKTISNVG